MLPARLTYWHPIADLRTCEPVFRVGDKRSNCPALVIQAQLNSPSFGFIEYLLVLWTTPEDHPRCVHRCLPRLDEGGGKCGEKCHRKLRLNREDGKLLCVAGETNNSKIVVDGSLGY